MEGDVLRALLIAAHPDDIELSCGGTAAKWARAGRELIYVVCTNGDKGTHDRDLSPFRLAELREEEQRQAAARIGAKEVVFLRHPDGELEACPNLRMELAMLIRHFRPQVIFTHDPWRRYQIHPDHRAAGMAACDAIVLARDHLFVPVLGIVGLPPHAPQELFLWGTDDPDYFEDIAETLPDKLDAVACHQSQLAQMPDWQERVRQWAADVGAKAGCAYAEGFHHIIFRPANHVFPRNAEPPAGEKAS